MLHATRRDFILGSAALAGGTLLRRQDGQPASAPRKLNLAIIGVAGRGGDNLAEVQHESIAVLCDVDRGRLDKAAAKHPGAKRFADFREALATPGLDAAVISTPDHTHAAAAIAAMKRGLHVFVEKPLAHTVREARAMAELAQQKRLITQMGIQIHADDNYRRVVETVRSGTLGAIRAVHVICNDRSWAAKGRPADTMAVPKELDWDLWLGPAAPRPYHKAYHPEGWRRYWDFGGGTLADMACHLMDLAFWALDLDHPTTVQADGGADAEGAPAGLTVRYQFAGRDRSGDQPGRAPVAVTWYDGEKLPPILTELGLQSWKKSVLFLGERGWLIADYGKRQLGPADTAASRREPAPSIAKSIGHHKEWLAAIRAADRARVATATTCSFAYAGPLTECVLLGIVSHRLGGEKLEWDAGRCEVTNAGAANALLSRAARAGWET